VGAQEGYHGLTFGRHAVEFVKNVVPKLDRGPGQRGALAEHQSNPNHDLSSFFYAMSTQRRCHPIHWYPDGDCFIQVWHTSSSSNELD
jgi:hypothetical protein